MVQRFFDNMFSNLKIPVIVCKNIKNMPIVYRNIGAGLLFSPYHSTSLRSVKADLGTLRDVLFFSADQDFENFIRMARESGHVDDYVGQIQTFDKGKRPCMIAGNTISYKVNADYFVWYFIEGQKEEEQHFMTPISTLLNSALSAEDTDSSIQAILAMAGQQIDVSRVYIFEEISPTTTRNTFEWCNQGVEPEIQMLQNLDKEDYPYDTIVKSGMFITEDVRSLPEEDSKLLVTQGIQAIAIIPFYFNNRSLGYVGFDDCEKCRKWCLNEIQYLQSITAILALLIKRRNAEREAKNIKDVLQIISDTSDEIVYANRLGDYTLEFVNKTLADQLGKRVDELIGEKCFKVLHKDKTEPCSFCPIPIIKMEPGADRSEVYIWENKDNRLNKTFQVKDNIVKWIDGEYVHVETAIDISRLKEQEERLRYLASTDKMTGVFNREWGGNRLETILRQPDNEGCLCFIDVDGLKSTNDQYGHVAGDSLLIETIRMICRHMVQDEIICRWGGDEFLVWLKGDMPECERRMKGIQEEMEEYNKNRSGRLWLSFSYGVVQFVSGHHSSIDAFVTEADEKMYQNKMVKRNGRRRRRRTDLWRQ